MVYFPLCTRASKSLHGLEKDPLPLPDATKAVKQADGRIKYKRAKEYERCRRGAPAFEPEACRYGLA
jgi:hypothetical protein